MGRELIVLARRTKASPPPDATHVYGRPRLIAYDDLERVLVSCTFTWDKLHAEWLRQRWQSCYPHAEVLVGGPAYGDAGGAFEPGRFVAQGYTITTRGCPGCDHPCLVPEREGPLRCLEIRDGFNVLDNNLLAAPRSHVEEVLAMLAEQAEPAKFTGGLDSRLLEDWFIEALQDMRIGKDGLWLAYDAASQRPVTFAAIEQLRAAGFSREKIRCYVLIGRKGDTLEAAEVRCRDVWDAGAMPFAMLWRGPEAATRNRPGWSHFVRAWILPAIMRSRARQGWPGIRGLEPAKLGMPERA